MVTALSGVSIRASSNLHGVKLDRNSTFEDRVGGIASRVSRRIDIVRLVKHVFVDTSVLLRCYYAFVLPILEYRSPVWGSAGKCHLQLLELQVCSVTMLCIDQSYRRQVAPLCMLYKVNSNINHCFISVLPSSSNRIRYTEASVAAHTLEFEV